MSQESSKTYGDQAHLLRAIEHAVTYDRQAAPRGIEMQPEHGHALIRFAEDDTAAVEAWAERTGATVVHGTHTYEPDSVRAWHEFGTRPGGAKGQLVGWDVDLWCCVNSPAPDKPADPEPAAPPAVNSPEWIAANDGHLHGCTGWPGCSCSATTAQAGE